MVMLARDWRGLEREMVCDLNEWPLAVLPALFTSTDPRGSVTGSSCLVYGGVFMGRSLLGTAVSGLLTVTVGGFDG